MTKKWLGVTKSVDADEIMHTIEERIERRKVAEPMDDSEQDAALIAAQLRNTMLPVSASDVASIATSSDAILLTEEDCDIVPRDYVIDWQHPLLGPLNARVRQVINAEVRRYLSATLEQQSFVNRQLLQAIRQLKAENAELYRVVENSRYARHKDNFE